MTRNEAPAGPTVGLSPGKARAAGFALWAGLFVVFVALPVQVLIGWLDQARDDLRATALTEQRNRVNRTLGALERSIDPGALVHTFLTRWVARRTTVAWTPRRLARWEADLRGRCRWPAATKVFWFDGQGTLLVPAGGSAPPGRRLWQTLFKALAGSPAALTEREKTDLARLLRQEFGPYASLRGLAQRGGRAVEVVNRGVLSFFWTNAGGAGPGAGQAGAPGGVIVLLPRLGLPPDWAVRAAIREHVAHGRLVGAWRRSTERQVGHPRLPPGLLRGIAQRGTEGRGTWRDERDGILWVGRINGRDLDLVLVAADDGRAGAMGRAVVGIARLRLALGLIEVGAALGFLAIGLGWTRLSLGLSTKFLLGILVAIALPLGSLGLVGVQRLARVQEAQRLALNRALERPLADLDQALTDGFSELEARLNRFFAQPGLRYPGVQSRIEALMHPWEAWGLHWTVAIPSREIWTGPGFQKFHREAPTRKTVEFFNGVNLKFLEYAGFPFAPETLTGTPTAEVEAVFAMLKSENPWMLKHFDRLEPLTLGGKEWIIYRGLVREPDGTFNGFFGLSFELSVLQSFLLRRALQFQRQAGERVRIWWVGSGKGTGHRVWDRLLQQAAATQGVVRVRLMTSRGPLAALARPLRSGGLVAAVIRPEREDVNLGPLFQGLLGMILVWSLIGAWLHGAVLRRMMLDPLLELREAVERMEEGNYAARLSLATGDELEELAGRFNAMGQGLQERARMGAFLRDDLVARAAAGTAAVALTRRTAQVCFAGLRGFSGLEVRLPPEQSLKLMSEFLGVCEETVLAHGGAIDKFIGDTAMALFFDGGALPAALALERRLTEWVAAWRGAGVPLGGFGIGLVTGTVLAGGIGSQRRRLDYTVVGDPVNLAARLEKLAGRDGRPALLVRDDDGWELPPGWVRRPLAVEEVRGREGRIRVFTPVSGEGVART